MNEIFQIWVEADASELLDSEGNPTEKYNQLIDDLKAEKPDNCARDGLGMPMFRIDDDEKVTVFAEIIGSKMEAYDCAEVFHYLFKFYGLKPKETISRE